jgi:DNA-binding NtrC family response regulator
MSSAPQVLLVSSNDGILVPLQEGLEKIGLEADVVRSCGHARKALERPNAPELLFIDAILPDGTCVEVIKLAARSPRPVQAIVITENIDYDLYLDAMDAGAADFLTPPFEAADIAWVLCSVRQNSASLAHQAA